MKLATGARVHCDYQPGMAMDAVSTATGLDTPWGHLTYVEPPPPGAYIREGLVPEFAILFHEDGTYEARVGAQGYAGTWRYVA